MYQDRARVVQLWSGEGRFGGVCWREQRRRRRRRRRKRKKKKEAWQGAGGAEKYKSGTGNGQIFSWKQPTEESGALKIKSRMVPL